MSKMRKIDRLGMACAKLLALIEWAQLAQEHKLEQHYRALYETTLQHMDEEWARLGRLGIAPVQLTMDDIPPDMDVEIPF